MKHLLTSHSALAVVLGLIAVSSSAGNDESTQLDSAKAEELFTAGQDVSRCSAYYADAEEVAKKLNMPAQSELFGNQARGWLLAGSFLLQQGAASKTFNAQFTSEQIQRTATTEIRAQAERDGGRAFQVLSARHKERCEHYGELVESVITILRRHSGSLRK